MKPTRHIAVLIETSREYGRGLLRGVSRFRREHPNWSIYFEQQDLGASLPQWFMSWKGDGILARITNLRTARALVATGLPMIDLRGGARKLGVPPFGPDNRAISAQAYEHLAACGLKHFAFVGEPSDKHVYDDQRREAFQQIVQDHGKQCHVFKSRFGGKSTTRWGKQQQQLAEWLHSLPKPLGVMCCHDDRGPQVLEACRMAKLDVPNEVAVMGVDNDEFLCGLAIPSLSSIDVNAERIGYEAAWMLDEMIGGKTKLAKPVFFPPLGVVARQSTDLVACDDPRIAAAVHLIQQHACNYLKVADIEKQLAVSRSSLNRRFKQIVGRSPKQEILRIQIETAKRKLVDTEAPIYAISERVGFRETKYFIAVFRKLVGITPRAYRLAGQRSRRE